MLSIEARRISRTVFGEIERGLSAESWHYAHAAASPESALVRSRSVTAQVTQPLAHRVDLVVVRRGREGRCLEYEIVEPSGFLGKVYTPRFDQRTNRVRARDLIALRLDRQDRQASLSLQTLDQ